MLQPVNIHQQLHLVLGFGLPRQILAGNLGQQVGNGHRAVLHFGLGCFPNAVPQADNFLIPAMVLILLGLTLYRGREEARA